MMNSSQSTFNNNDSSSPCNFAVSTTSVASDSATTFVVSNSSAAFVASNLSLTSVDFNPSITSVDSNLSTTSIESNPSTISVDSNLSITSVDSNPSTSSVDSNPSATSVDSNPSITSVDSNPSTTSVDSNPLITSVGSNPSTTYVISNPSTFLASNPSTSVDTNPSRMYVDSNPSKTFVGSNLSTASVGSNASKIYAISSPSTSIVASNIPTLVASNRTTSSVASNSSKTFVISSLSTNFAASNDSDSTTAVVTSLNTTTTASFLKPETSFTLQTTETGSPFLKSLNWSNTSFEHTFSNPITNTFTKSLNSTAAITLPISKTTFSFTNPERIFADKTTETGSLFSNSLNGITSASLSSTTANLSLSNSTTSTFSCLNSTTTAFSFPNLSNSTFPLRKTCTTSFTSSNPTDNSYTFTNSSNSAAAITSPNSITSFRFSNPSRYSSDESFQTSSPFSNPLNRITSTDLSPTTKTLSLSSFPTNTFSCSNSTTTTSFTFQFPSTNIFPTLSQKAIISSHWKPQRRTSYSSIISGMSERTKDSRISLSELQKEPLLSVRYMIKVPNFFNLPEHTECTIESPSFEYANASWKFLFVSRRTYEKNEADEWVKKCDVYLARLKSEERKHTIFYTVFLLDANDKEYNRIRNVQEYFEDDERSWIYYFNNDHSFYGRRDNLTLVIHLICKKSGGVNVVQETISIKREIAGTSKGYRISLFELPKKTLFSVTYRMKVPNFIILQEYDNSEITGQSFEFAYATWRFNFESRKLFEDEKGEWIKTIAVYLTRLSSLIQKHFLFYTISLLDANDEECQECSNVEKIDKNGKMKVLAHDTYNSDSSYDRRDHLTFVIRLICEDPLEVNAAQEPLLANTGPTDEKKNCEVSLFEMPRKMLSSVNYRMKVPNFFTLSEYDDNEFKINGPPFQFASATWQFRFESEEMHEADTSEKRFQVFLMRLNSEVQKHSITYIISLLNGNDENYDEYRKGHVYDEAFSNHCICMFSNKKLPYNRRDTLTLFVHLICDESSEMNTVQESLPTNRGKYLRQDFKDVLLNGENHNITFNVQGKEFQAHQDILKARSEVFHSMLSHDMLEKNSSNINVPDCDPEAFEQLLLYIYTGNVESLDENNMFGLYYAADKYSMSYLKKECKEFIKNSLSVSNVCEVIDLASKHSDRNMLDYATNYFIINADDIFLTVKWQMFLKENPTVANELIIKSFKRLKLKTSS